MRTRFELAVLLLIVALPASAQRGSRGPQLEVSVLPSNSPPVGASVRAARILADSRTRELLLSGFPAAMHFRLELWRAEGLFNEIESSVSWEMLVRYEPYNQQYLVFRRMGTKETEDLGGYSSLDIAEGVIERPYLVPLRPASSGVRYYYNLILDVETLSVRDLDELQRWLRGDLQPVVKLKRDPFSALWRGVGTLLSRVLGGEKHHFEARSGQFRP